MIYIIRTQTPLPPRPLLSPSMRMSGTWSEINARPIITFEAIPFFTFLELMIHLTELLVLVKVVVMVRIAVVKLMFMMVMVLCI